MLSQTAEYALRAAVTLAQDAPRARTAQEVADATKVPQGYMSKVLLGLTKAGIVQSQRGLGGGFSLAKTPEEITILDIINVFDPVVQIQSCPLGLPEHTQLCPLHRRLSDAAGALIAAFGHTTLADLLREQVNGTCLTQARRLAQKQGDETAGEADPCDCSSPIRLPLAPSAGPAKLRNLA